jgi:ABC-type polysaccharide/polyol phosphate transport system ATPase subunit
MKPIIRVENLSKQYHIGATPRAVRYVTLRESLTEAALAPVRRLRQAAHTDGETIWALKDVSFEVMPGEVVGIIGSNGSGKSTLLKILSRITKPTTGRAELYGHVASLLEVGTGFHPDLTGRENVYLNGAILGMGRREIASKFDEIVSFAEIDKFLDTPVKHYSSGMYVRLAFAVAAHLDPDILIVDEVLSVGDMNFQRKCLGKMDAVTRSGRTVLFVTHSMNMINQLCETVILLQNGRISRYGPAAEVVDYYQEICDLPKEGESPRSQSQAGRSLSQTIFSFSARGGKGSVEVFAAPGVKWSAMAASDFIEITSPATQTGNGEVRFTVSRNSGDRHRTGTITVSNDVISIMQGAAFSDVPEDHIFYEEISKLSARAITVSHGKGDFRPDQLITREQFAIFLVKALGEYYPPNPAAARFTDVSPDNLGYRHVERLVERGIILDTDEEYFRPNDPVTREQMAEWLIRAKGARVLPSPEAAQTFSDVPPASRAFPFVERMVELGLTAAAQSPYFYPDAPVTRAEIASLLVRTFKL